jgi:predicted alpha/beta-hydrolase family hydrolase
MIETGLAIFLAFWLLWVKLNIMTRLKLLGRPFLLDLSVTAAVFLMYGGTGAGMASATMAAIVMSINISLARYFFGYYQRRDGEWHYFVGKINQADKIINHKRKINAQKTRTSLHSR